ncbi:MAG: hypothetical protein Q7R30_14680 [Acidobacteriota bacterium]|nr:hypothetical protein [Acidobacteriota bacterium]
MPILTRPVREQLEHDRVIRLLQPKYKRKTDVIINPGSEQNQSVMVGELAVFPDVLIFAEGGRKLLGMVEVETGESVNQLEALAEWNVFSKLKVPLHLYVPPSSVDAARRLCAEHQIPIAEMWTFHTNFDQVRFTLIHRSPDAAIPRSKAVAKPAAKPTPVATLRQAQGRPDLSTGSRSPRAQSRGEQGRGAKAKPAPKPVAKPKPAAKKAAARKPVKKAAPKKPAKPAKKSTGKKRR